jgi:hypothetical protein
MQIAPSLINRNAAEVRVLLGDKGYDDQQIQSMAPITASAPCYRSVLFTENQLWVVLGRIRRHRGNQG